MARCGAACGRAGAAGCSELSRAGSLLCFTAYLRWTSAGRGPTQEAGVVRQGLAQGLPSVPLLLLGRARWDRWSQKAQRSVGCAAAWGAGVTRQALVAAQPERHPQPPPAGAEGKPAATMVLRMRHFIDSHKAANAAAILLLIAAYGAWDLPAVS